MNKRILVLGDHEAAKYHSVHELSELLELFRCDGYDVTVRCDYGTINDSYLKGYSICLNYIDNWESNGNEDLENSLLSYVREGGNLLSIHNGILLKPSDRLLKLHGGYFVGHEEYTNLRFVSEGDHPIHKEVTDFSIMDEPYEFQFYSPEHMEFVLSYIRNGIKYPAGWIQTYGKGAMLYFSFGHTKDSFRNDSVKKLCRNAVLWMNNRGYEAYGNPDE